MGALDGSRPTVGAQAVGIAQGALDAAVRYANEDADADHARLTELECDVDAEVMRWGDLPPMFTLRDPDGNVLVLVERE